MSQKQFWLKLIITLVLLLNSGLSLADPANKSSLSLAESTQTQILAQNQTRTNSEIRQWYNDQVSVVPALNQNWIKQGKSAKERALKAYQIRHHARIKARAMMANPDEVKRLQARDQQKYGNPDGPTFEYLVEKNRAAGMTGDQVYEAIIDSSKRTNKDYNQRYGVKPKSL